MNDSLDIAILIKTDSDWHRNIIRGISQYAQDHGGWRFTVPEADHTGEVNLPDNWQGDGIICRLTSVQLGDAIRERNVACVNVSWLSNHQEMSKVVSDERACAEMVADHFIKKQYENFGYISYPPWCNYENTIEDTLRDELAKVGAELNCFPLSDDVRHSMGVDTQQLSRWLLELPKPVAITTWSSHVGYKTLIACDMAELEVPRDVSILCIEHDNLWSELAPVPLSNLDQDPTRVGYTAAQTLHAQIQGAGPSEAPGQIAPIAVVQRLSTEATAVNDPILRLALEYIYEHAKDGVTVSELVSILGVSRRSLEGKFKRNLNCTPAAHIRRIQLQSVARLLRTTNMSIAQIAKRTGYEYPEVLMRSFKREFKLTPMQFRESGKVQTGDGTSRKSPTTYGEPEPGRPHREIL